MQQANNKNCSVLSAESLQATTLLWAVPVHEDLSLVHVTVQLCLVLTAT